MNLIFAFALLLTHPDRSLYQEAVKSYYLDEHGQLKQGNPVLLKKIIATLDANHPDVKALLDLYAVEAGEGEALERLFASIGGSGKISLFQTLDGQSLLNLAVQNGLWKTTLALLSHGYDINRPAQICSDGSELTSSLIAVMLKSTTDPAFKPIALQMIRDPHLDPKKKTSLINGNSPIWCALDMAKSRGDYDFLHLLLSEHRSLSNARNPMSGNTPLFDAIIHNQTALAATLIYYGADTAELYDKRVPLTDCTKDPVMIGLLKKQIPPENFF